MKTLNMQFIRYLNLFEGVTGIRTRSCFPYNNMIVFAVKKNQVSKAIGSQGENVRRISDTIKKRVKIVSLPEPSKFSQNKNFDGHQEFEKPRIPETGESIFRFFSDIVSPITFKSLDVNDEIVMNAGSQNKAALIGRNKARLKEMQSVAKEYFNKDFRIA